jgi:hypothetical protein
MDCDVIEEGRRSSGGTMKYSNLISFVGLMSVIKVFFFFFSEETEGYFFFLIKK